ncbi:pyrophosphatase PpaX [Insulibacter thermoxylanivorax]|uniref:Pyrophosphatase PpaX n=1 Tax=Insulibacter thermoxylanivorax TaxID=2749268 RepID=A0A916VHL5_9BACL|nr:pyrophosphatase PpaX [Insulibacter thermoxylanivorax]GFR38450.1 pyrophosphatase PpaX [Insulibacter thermoxylanivorax]
MALYDTVLFDLDGTIIDTNELIIASIQHVWQQKYGTLLNREKIIPQMGLPLEQQFQTFTGLDEVQDLIAEYRKFNYAAHDDFVRPFPYVKEVLTTLRENGIRTGAVTTKMRASSLRSLAFCGLDELLEVLVAVDDVEHPKPHPEPVLKAVEQLAADPSRTLMVGDSPFDLVAAREAGAASAAVAWSLKGEDVLREYEPTHVIYNMRELLPLVGLEDLAG